MHLVIAEDSTLFREGLARLLIDAGHDVVAKVDSAALIEAAVVETRPDLLIVDIRMPPDFTDDGARTARRLKSLYPDMSIMLLSHHIERHQSVDLVTQGGIGYLLKDRVLDVEDFLDALERVAAGGSALDPEVVRELITSTGASDPLQLLTSRELDVLQLMSEGRTNHGIASRLYLSERTVETHVASIFVKLNLPGHGAAHRRVLAVVAYLRGRDASSIDELRPS